MTEAYLHFIVLSLTWFCLVFVYFIQHTAPCELCRHLFFYLTITNVNIFIWISRVYHNCEVDRKAYIILNDFYQIEIKNVWQVFVKIVVCINIKQQSFAADASAE